MSNDAGEYENAQKGQRGYEHVKISIVSSADAVAHPGTVMIEPICNE